MDQAGRGDRSGRFPEDLKITIRRSNPSAGEVPEDAVYTLNYSEGMTLSGALDYIYHFLDPTIGFRPYRCNKGVCLSCLVTVNGKNSQACCTFLKPGDQLLIEPFRHRLVVRDLVTTF
jgi:succinate dehydrogenase / fumarate reductase, iron-sulfur subunit